MLDLWVWEFRRSWREAFPFLLVGLALAETFFVGNDLLRRSTIGPEDLGAGITHMSQLWAHRAVTAPTFFPFLAGVTVWHSVSRDMRHDTAALVFSQPVTTRTLWRARLPSVLAMVVTAHLSGILLGVALCGVLYGVWPDATLLAQVVVLNGIPGMTAWVVIVSALAAYLKDLKTLAIPLGILWLAEAALPSISLTWFHRELADAAVPLAQIRVWWHVLQVSVLCLAAHRVFIRRQERERAGVHSDRKTSKSARWRPRPAGWGITVYHLKVTLGRRLPIGCAGAAILALILFGPWGPAGGISGRAGGYFSVAFSELLFPLFGLMIAGDFLLKERELEMEDLLWQLPRAWSSLLLQKGVALGAYFGALSFTYLATAALVGPRIDIFHGLLVLVPSICVLSAVAVSVSTILGNRVIGYVAAGVYWLSAYSLEERFPWIASPMYFLAEYTFKTGRDRLFLNKAVLVAVAAALLIVSFRKGMRYLPRVAA